MPVGSNAEILELDGENYGCSLPTGKLLMELTAPGNKGLTRNVHYRWDSDGFMLLDERSDGWYFIESSHNLKPVFEVKPPDGSGRSLTAGVNEWFYRPVLFPLDRDGHYTPVMREQYRNGEIVRLGTFVVSGTPYIPGKIPNRYETEINPYFNIWFDDSSSKRTTLRWMQWNGVLVCCDNLLICPPEFLIQRGLVSSYPGETALMSLKKNTILLPTRPVVR